ncbi:hypothetical protein ACFLZM_07445 [Thermodesulfobacteriota bacterium]
MTGNDNASQEAEVTFARDLGLFDACMIGSVESVFTMAKIIILGIFIFYGLKRIFDFPTHAVTSLKRSPVIHIRRS